LRAIDELGRFGGEEFLVLLPGTSLQQAEVCAERLREAVAALQVLPRQGERVTVSIGVAEFAPGDTPVALLERADRALYRAKTGGRNRFVSDAPPLLARAA
jgi:diguanylate cyclase (GGDEF)-like protein